MQKNIFFPEIHGNFGFGCMRLPMKGDQVDEALFCAMADAFATSFMVMGLEGAKKVLAAHPELKAYFILSDDNGGYKIWHSESLKENLAK